MTTPQSTPTGSPVTLPVDTTPAQICPALGQGQTVMIVNLDSTYNLYVGRSSGITTQNAILVAPGGSIVEDASTTVWAFTDSPNPPLIAQLSSTTSQYNLSPSQILNAIDIIALSTAIATAIAQTGVSLLGAPTPLYDTHFQPNASCLFGGTIYPSTGESTASAITNFENLISRTISGRKTYNGPEVFPVYSASNPPPDDIQAASEDGQVLYVCFKPSMPGTAPYGSASDAAAMIATLISILNPIPSIGYVGFPAANVKVECWQEITNGDAGYPNAAAYVNGMGFYAPYIRNPSAGYPGLKLVHDPTRNGTIPIKFFPGPPNLATVVIDEYGVDWYAANAANGNYPNWGPAATGPTNTDFANSDVGIANANNLPFSILECGVSATSFVPTATQVQNYYVNDPYGRSILAVVESQLAAGRGMGMIAPYMSYQLAGQNYIPPGDPRIGYLQQISDACQGSNIVTIPAGETLQMPALSPSPNAGYATADQLSYDISINAIAGGGSTIPFIAAKMAFYNQDATTAVPVDQEQWFLPLGANGGNGTVITGKGPQRGAYMSIMVTNLDTVPCEIGVQVNGTGRAVSDDDWEWDSHLATLPAVTPALTACGGPADANSLGVIGGGTPVSVAPGASSTRILSLFAGQVYLRWGVTGATNANECSLTLTPLPATQWGSSTLYNVSGGDDVYVSLPRAPMLVTMTNGQTTGSVDFFANVTIQRMNQ